MNISNIRLFLDDHGYEETGEPCPFCGSALWERCDNIMCENCDEQEEISNDLEQCSPARQ